MSLVSLHITASLRCLLGDGLRFWAWHPLTSSWVPLLAVVFGVVLLPEEYLGSGSFWEVPSLEFQYFAIPWFYSGYSTSVSRWCFWLLLHKFRVKVESDPEVDSWTVFGVSTTLSVALVTGWCVCRVRCTGYLGFTGR